MGDFVNNLYTGSNYELSVQYETFAQAAYAIEQLSAIHLLKQQSFISSITEIAEQWPYTIDVDDHVLPCTVSLVNDERDCYFVHFAIPLTALTSIYCVVQPLTPAHNEWLAAVEHSYLFIAEQLYDLAPFLFAVIGENVSGSFDARTLTADDVEQLHCIVPTPIQHALHIQHDGLPISTKLAVY